jgi:hypothetical protein
MKNTPKTQWRRDANTKIPPEILNQGIMTNPFLDKGKLILERVKLPDHLKVILKYGAKESSFPFESKFHHTGLPETEAEVFSPLFDYSNILVDEIIYRYYFGGNMITWLTGKRMKLKSSTAIQLCIIEYKIAAQALYSVGINPKPLLDIMDSMKWIVDNDVAQTEIINSKFPPFMSIVRDEFDASIAGAGTMTLKDAMKDTIDRIRGAQFNMQICSPKDMDYSVDYYLEVWENLRIPKPGQLPYVVSKLYSNDHELMGAIRIPLPEDKYLAKYNLEVKPQYLERAKEMEYNLDKAINKIISELLKDPKFPPPCRGNKSLRMQYIGETYTIVSSQKMKEYIEQICRSKQEMQESQQT